MPFETNRSMNKMDSVDQTAQAVLFAEGLPLFGVIYSFLSSMFCVCAKDNKKKTTY